MINLKECVYALRPDREEINETIVKPGSLIHVFSREKLT